jgi:hypothetical protein
MAQPASLIKVAWLSYLPTDVAASAPIFPISRVIIRNRRWDIPVVRPRNRLNVPFCDLSILGYSGKTADLAPFTTLSPESRFTLRWIDGAFAISPAPCSASREQKRPRSGTCWFAVESNRVRTYSPEYSSVLGSIDRPANSQPLKPNLQQCPSRQQRNAVVRSGQLRRVDSDSFSGSDDGVRVQPERPCPATDSGNRTKHEFQCHFCSKVQWQRKRQSLLGEFESYTSRHQRET